LKKISTESKVNRGSFLTLQQISSRTTQSDLMLLNSTLTLMQQTRRPTFSSKSAFPSSCVASHRSAQVSVDLPCLVQAWAARASKKRCARFEDKKNGAVHDERKFQTFVCVTMTLANLNFFSSTACRVGSMAPLELQCFPYAHAPARASRTLCMCVTGDVTYS
jgi:hypothetical protein